MRATRLRPFVPAQDFAASRRFYADLGFDEVGSGPGLVVLDRDGQGFILQDYYVRDWAENCMVQLLVHDATAWWQAIAALDLPTRYGVRAPVPPGRQEWGGLVSYVWDPCGVLWHVTQLPR